MIKYGGHGEKKKLKHVSQQDHRKPYLKPQLTQYGHIEELTKGGGGPSFDAGGTKAHR